MKREFLKGLGLTDEQIDKIMAENGKDIEKAKGDTTKLESDLKAKETEVETLQGQLKDANKQIEDFKGMDIEAIKKAADDYKEKFEKAEKEAKKEMDKLQFDHALDKALAAAKAKNTKAVKALLDIEGLKLNKDEIVGLSDQLDKIKKDNDYLFDSAETKKTPTFVWPGGASGDPGEKEGIGAKLAKQAQAQAEAAKGQDIYFK